MTRKHEAGDKVTFNGGFPGTVIRRYSEGMIEVRGERGMVCIPDEDAVPAYETINGRTYKVTRQPSEALTYENIKELGWDGYSYMLEGARGAVYLAYRSAETGKLHIITNLRF